MPHERLDGAVSYDRIAGHFRFSLFEVADEALAKVTGPVRIICNSDLDPRDFVIAAAAQVALRRSGCSGKAGVVRRGWQQVTIRQISIPGYSSLWMDISLPMWPLQADRTCPDCFCPSAAGSPAKKIRLFSK